MNKLTEKHRGIFDDIENAITFYLLEKKVDKMLLWGYGINVFELSLFIEEHLIRGITQLKDMEKEEEAEK